MLCTSCSKDLIENAVVCTNCGAPTKNYRPAAIPSDDGMKYLIPTNVSPWAMLAGYLGIFSLLIFVAPISIIIGIVALIHLKKHPEYSGRGRALFGIIFPALLLLGVAVIFLVAFLS